MAVQEPATLLVIENGVATISLNMPKQKNSLGGELINSLVDNLKACIEKPEVQVVVFTNVGNTFCAGANLKGGGGEKAKYTLVDLFKIMQECPKVIVGKINGHCTGGGVGLAAACDISVMGSTFDMGFTEVRIGVAPAIISVVCLPKMRRADAAELMLSGEKIKGGRAAQVGLVTHAVPVDQIEAKVNEIVNKLVRGGPKALAATKSLVYRVPGMQLDEAFKWTGELSMNLFKSDEAMQGIMAFNQKKDAPWVPKSKL